MIDFATLQGLTIPEGVVTEIKDANGVVLWSARKAKKPIILEVTKITSDTYAGSTSYSDEEFILLYVTPESGGSVNITYGGVTKTIADTSGSTNPNSQQVFFGTFNGVSDEVTTPASGTLIIEGDYNTSSAFSMGQYTDEKNGTSSSCDCITKIIDTGNMIALNNNVSSQILTSVTIGSDVQSIGDLAFAGNSSLTNFVVDANNKYYSAEGGILFNKDKTEIYRYPSVTGHYTIPNGVTAIGSSVFYNCSKLTGITLPESVTSIGDRAFYYCSSLTSITSSNTVTSIGDRAFYYCTELLTAIFPSVTTVDDFAFYNCNKLTSVGSLSNAVTIGRSAFWGCDKLADNFTLFDIETINYAAFERCYTLTNILIGNNIQTIGDYAFAHLVSPNTNRVFTFTSTIPPILGSSDVLCNLDSNGILTEGNSLSIIVPKGCGETYKVAEGWSDYANYIVEAS